MIEDESPDRQPQHARTSQALSECDFASWECGLLRHGITTIIIVITYDVIERAHNTTLACLVQPCCSVTNVSTYTFCILLEAPQQYESEQA